VSDSLYRKLGVLPSAELTTVQELFAAVDDHCADAVELATHATLFAPTVTASRYDGIAYIKISSPASVGVIEAYDEDDALVDAFDHIDADDTIELVDCSLSANDGSYVVGSVSAGGTITLKTSDLAVVAEDTTVKVILRAKA
jgi:hypothetical protein